MMTLYKDDRTCICEQNQIKLAEKAGWSRTKPVKKAKPGRPKAAKTEQVSEPEPPAKPPNKLQTTPAPSPIAKPIAK